MAALSAGVVRALDQKGSPIGEARYAFAPGDRETEAAFDLPVELRNDIARLEIAGERSAGAVQLLDKRWRRRAVGIVSGSSTDTAQPLLASTFYLTRALAPFADVRLADKGSPQQAIAQFLDQKLPMIVLADVGTLSPEIRERLNAWIEKGGVLTRFAGPRLAQADDDLVPVKLRRGGRSLGGSLPGRSRNTWRHSQPTVHSPVLLCQRTSPSTGRSWPNPMQRWQPKAGPRWSTARRSSPGNIAARDWSRCFMSAPTCAGPICHCLAPSWKC